MNQDVSTDIDELKKNYVIDQTTEIVSKQPYGVNFKTRQRYEPHREVIIKAIKIKKIQDNKDVVLKEIAALFKVKNEALCEYMATYKDKKYIFLVREHPRGQSLIDKLIQEPEERLTEDKARHYMRQLFQVIESVHRRGIVHRDIELQNVIITEDDRIKLIDFGVAKATKKSEL